MSHQALRHAFVPARREERRSWGMGDYASEINDATDTGNIATAEALLAEARHRFLTVAKGSKVRFVANPGIHTGSYEVLSIDAKGWALLDNGVICKPDRLTLTEDNPLP